MSKAIIIGGGIIGLFSAYYLHQSGWEVDILEQGDLADNCSFGNAGMVTPSHFVPLASPGMVEQGIRWMFDSKSPFYVKPSLNPELLSWGLKFVRSSTKKHVERSAAGLADFSIFSKSLFMEFEKNTAIDFGFTDNGILMLFKTTQMQDEEQHLVEKANSMNLHAEYLSPAECRKLQPDIELDILGAVHYRCDAHMYPNKLMRELVKYLEASGVNIHRQCEVIGINHNGPVVTSVNTRDKTYTADKYLIAGGSWSPAIARLTGLNLPLMPGKGYSFMVSNPVKKMSIPSILCEARVAVTPMNGSIRFGGTMEVGKINKQVNMNRVKGIVESVPRYFPDFNLPVPEQRDVWFGFRPVSPDGLPYIGATGKYNNLAIATGHAMIGLSLAPATGKAIADTFNGIKTEVDLSLFKPERYQ